MADINFKCPHCGQDLNGPEELAGESIDCPVCGKSFEIPGGIIEVPKSQMAPPPKPAPPSPSSAAANAETTSIPPPSSNDDKGKTVRIELPPEFLAEPEKHIFKIKRIQH
jgi:rRNA maturation protein Nop10